MSNYLVLSNFALFLNFPQNILHRFVIPLELLRAKYGYKLKDQVLKYLFYIDDIVYKIL